LSEFKEWLEVQNELRETNDWKSKVLW
jgi:hypothetical protein